MLFKMLVPGRGMLSFRYRGTTIRTSAFKLLFLGFCTISMVMFMRLQGLFLAMPPNEDKHPLDRTFPKHTHDDLDMTNLIHLPSRIQEIPSARSLLRTDGLHKEIMAKSTRVPSTVELSLPTLHLHMEKATVDVEKLRQYVRQLNAEREIKNLAKFPDNLGDQSIVIIVQVHNRPDYFSYLLRSLKRARGIENTLVVVSHDYYNEEIDRMVQGIDFCKVLQIFFPFSMQLYPNQFPGINPKDCPRDISKKRAKEIKCTNADHPDKYGHFREAKFTMTKHHWWWKVNTVFDGLNITKNYNGPVLFLEEDHYAAPDFCHVLKQLYQAKLRDPHCQSGCDIMTLGTYTVPTDYKATGHNKVELAWWKSVKHNMGMAFDRNTWNMLKACRQMFCTYDDYNWDWTLMKISKACLSRPLRAMVMKAPRMFHIGECGVHHKKKQCKPDSAVNRFNSIINNNDVSFYPQSVEFEEKYSEPSPPGQPNGGWGDTRDHALCLSFDQYR